jgi:4-amino-4-deoxy-L-arabinose transferase-like glycosyltransferase
MTARRIKTVLIVVLAAGFLSRLVLVVAFKTYAHPVVWEYETIANNLLAGKGFSFVFLGTTYRSFATPLFAYLCAAVYALTNHSFLAILLVQSLFNTALALVIFKIAKLVFSEAVGLLAAALVAFHPGFMYYDAVILIPLSIDSFFIAAITLVLLKNKERPSVQAMSLVGGLIGLAALCRGITAVLLLPAIIYPGLFARSLHFKHQLKIMACVLCATLVVLAPWLIRNYMVQKRFVFISSTSAENFWRGNNLLATGTSYDAHGTKIIYLWPEDFRTKVASLTEIQQMDFFKSEAWSFIRANPRQATKLYLKKLYYFWWFSPQSGITYPQKYLAIYKYFYVPLLSFFLIGVGFALATGKKAVRESSLILLSLPLTICLAQSLFYVEGRHRWLIEPIIIIFFSYGIMESWKLLRSRVSRTAVAGRT